jgi:bifunctional DNA-binding transcriptional regulator/antitoxin component of YhaV-PrlF toxin-antitoxin module
MSAAAGPNEESLGVLLPDELVERCGFKEGDVFEIKNTADGFVLTPVNTDLQEQLYAARFGMQKYRVALRDLAE